MEKLNRCSGILMHVTSLPNNLGLGVLSDECEKFLDFMELGGFKCWQVLPISDCGYAKSPYSSVSSFAINPYLIDIKEFLSEDEINSFGFNRYNSNAKEEEEKFDRALHLIYEKKCKSFDRKTFEKENRYWLEDYAIFKVLKNEYKVCWNEWPQVYRDRNKEEIEKYKLLNKKEIDKVKFIQFIADRQWNRVKNYAKKKGIEIFGDIPMYVELDSSDVWSNPKNWQLEHGKPKQVAGIPPDYFNVNGQLWGNPLYNYTLMSKNKYDFWIKRFRRLNSLFDIVRIDHFVAFSKYWAVPSNAESAKEGKWVKGVGPGLLKAITSKCQVKLVAEDLGVVTNDVVKLRESFDIPGLKVLQFAFDGDGDHPYQPHNYEKNSVAYIGTHDNNTFMGLLNEGNWDKINRFKRYFQMPLERSNEEVVDNAILALYRSSASMVVLTPQDILKLDSSARMNTPGVEHGQWLWQLSRSLDGELAHRYKNLSELYGR